MYKVGINFDEISDDLDVALRVMKECEVSAGELRTLNNKNFVFWTDEEVSSFKKRIEEASIELIAAATPLFKWYVNSADPEIPHDSFGFNPRLSNEEKKKIIERTFEIAVALRIPRLRIFSGLGIAENAGALFASDPLLGYTLELANKNRIDVYVENEPVCQVHTSAQILQLLENQHDSRLKLWLDIANLLELGEEIEDDFLATVSHRLGYVHVKDFVIENGVKKYMPVGEGTILYPQILESIDNLGIEDLIFTVETHAKSNKIDASVRSLKATKQLVNSLSRTE